MNFNTQILIYAGEGTWDISVHLCEKMLRTNFNHGTIKRSNNLEADLNNSVTLLVMPGGNAAYMVDTYPSEKIKNFIMGGGSFLAICAGAILSSTNNYTICRVNGNNEEAQEIINSGNFYTTPRVSKSLYLGKTITRHIVNQLKDASHKDNICGAKVKTFYDFSVIPDVFSLYCYSGPAFIDSPPETRILLQYQKAVDLHQLNFQRETGQWFLTGQKMEELNPSAIISYPLGSGKIVLSGVHIEMDPNFYAEACLGTNYSMDDFPLELTSPENEMQRQKIVKICLQELGIGL